MSSDEWRGRIEDMLGAIASVQRHIDGLTRQQFIADEKSVHAVAYALSIIGEASAHLPPELRARYPDVPWSQTRQMRNFVIHQYGKLDPLVLWETAVSDLSPLVQQLQEILAFEP